MLGMIKDISSVECNCENSTEFKRVVNDLSMISAAADKSLDKMLNSESNLLLNAFVRVMR